MKKENITTRQAVSIMALFIVGSSLVLGISKESKQDAWMGMLISVAAMLPVIYIYARLMSRYPGMNLFDICIAVFGKMLGKIAIALFAWYAFHLGALVLKNFSEFIQITAFDLMPQTISLLCLMFLVVWVSKRGIEVLGRWSLIALPLLLAIVTITILMLIKDMHLSVLLPVGENLRDVPKDVWADFTFPFAETVLFLAVMNTLKPGEKPGKAWVYGLLIGSGVLLIGGFFRNVLVLGLPLDSDMTFPSYGAVSVIIAGNFLSRIEGIVGADLLLSGFVKISICLMVASKGFASLLDEGDYRPFVAPIGLLMVALACIVYKNIMEMLDFLNIYKYYALLFQVALPILLCITAEIKFIIKNKKEKGAAPSPAPAGEG